ncbi:MAG: DEAD/DEAH box helicase [Sandaracinaceae bacterium]|nr:DEAD/DEAH box helicase [Sandaracinaceae bacterium]
MTLNNDLSAAPLGLGETLRAQGFEALTTVQAAVVAADAVGRDLRVSSQTGSGKTVAIGLAVAPEVAAHRRTGARNASPCVLVIAPTRELAQQLGRELTWLYEPLNARVVAVTGGTNPLEERRELSSEPAVVVGTPGRLLDHLRHGGLSLANMSAVVLDEADQMLDMDFEEELHAILGHAPDERTTHLVSATFPPAVQRLASRLQRDPLAIEGTTLGSANTDIDHIAMWVQPGRALDAVINTLLSAPDDKTLLFVRTRADTEGLAAALCDNGFPARALHGDMTQRERTGTFELFRSGACKLLVATDVAARGLDVQDIGQVIQVDPPTNADIFTHRSGRTGRAGRQGRNVLFVPPRARSRAEMLFRSARVKARFEDVPSAEDILAAAQDRLFTSVSETIERDSASTRDAEQAGRRRLAELLLDGREPRDVVAALLTRMDFAGPCAPRNVQPFRDPRDNRDARPARAAASAPRDRHADSRDRQPDVRERPAGPARARAANSQQDGAFVTFQVSWGEEKGADVRRLLAILCRKGDVTSQDIGEIRVQQRSSAVDVHASVAEQFERNASKPDHRDPQVRVRRWAPPAAQKATKGAKPRKQKVG